MRNPGRSRQRILDAAEQVVVGQGVRHLTLDAIALRAGVSKGGLLYHFPTKHALLRAMVERLCSTFEARRRDHATANGEPQAALAAHVAVALGRRATGSVAAALIAAIANDTRLLNPMREHMRGWLPRLQPAAPSFADRAIVWLATEGLWLLELLELSPLNSHQRADIAARLNQLALSARREAKGAVRRRRPAQVSAARLPRVHHSPT